MVEQLGGSLSTTGSPYRAPNTCYRCGAQWYDSHVCPLQTAVAPQRPITQWSFHLICGGKFGQHDFAIGATHAVCNRCEKVVVLPFTTEHFDGKVTGE